MSFGIVATIGSAVIGGIAATSAANSASSANRHAVDAQTSAANADRELAREQRDKNERLFAGYLGDEAQASAYMSALETGTGTYTPATGGAPITVTRAQVMTQLQGTPLSQLAQTTYTQAQAIADQSFAGDTNLATQEYNDLTGANDTNYDDSYAAAVAARTGRRDVAQSNLDQRITNNDAVYDAFDAEAQNQANKAVDLNFSRGGVTGLVGQTRAGVAQVGQDYALNAAHERTQLNADAYDPYYTDVTNAENSYATDVGNATDARNVNRLNITGNRANRNQTAFDNRQNSYASNLSHREGDEAASYADYASYLRDRQQRGFDARGQIASGGQSYVQSATNANNNAANAISQGAYQQGQIQQQLYGDVAGIVGDAYGSIIRPQKAGSTPNYGDPKAIAAIAPTDPTGYYPYG